MNQYKSAFAIIIFLVFCAQASFAFVSPVEFEANRTYKRYFKKHHKQEVHIDKSLHFMEEVTNCDLPVLVGNHGIDFSTNQKLKDAACDLRDAFPTTFQSQFSVYDYGVYMLLPHTDKKKGVEKALEVMKNTAAQNAPYYLLIGAEIDQEDFAVTFHTELKLPTTGEFDEMNEALEQVAKVRVEEAMKAKYELEKEEVGEGKVLLDNVLPQVEIAGINELKKIIEEILAGDFPGDFNDDYLFQTGFLPALAEIGSLQDVSGTGAITKANVEDYARLQSGIVQLADVYQDVANEIAAATTNKNDPNGTSLGLSLYVFITDDNNYDSGEFKNIYENLFDARTEKVVLWFHYHEPLASSPEMFFRSKNNFSEAEAEAVLQKHWDEEVNTEPPVTKPTELKGGDCPKFPDEISLEALKWNTKGNNGDNLYTCLGVDVFPAEYDSEGKITSGLTEYWGAFTCGVIDGLADNINGIGSIVSGVIDVARYGLPDCIRPSWIPDWSTYYGALDVAWRVVKTEALEVLSDEGWDGDFGLEEKYNEYMSDKAKFIAKVQKSACAFFEKGFLSKIALAMRKSLEDWFGDIGGANGNKKAGYTQGGLVFNIILGVLTGGIAASGKAIMQVTKKGIGAIGKVSEGIVSGVSNMKTKIDDLFTKLPADKKRKCRKIGGGCFLIGTSVLTAFGQKPIEKVSLGSYVYTNAWVNSQNTVLDESGQEIRYDPFVSKDQQNVDATDLEKEEWFNIHFEMYKYDGSLIKIQLLRPKWWLNKVKSWREGEYIYLDLPEQEIAGAARVISLSRFRFTRTYDNEDSNYELQPVTGVFEHISDDVWELIFDDGKKLNVTSSHPIFSSSDGGWKKVRDIEIGERILSKEGDKKLLSKKGFQTSEQVFNLEVKSIHNFFAGASEIVVHNICADPNKIYKINGWSPSNSKYSKTNGGPGFREARIDGKKVEVPIDGNGFPNFNQWTFPPGNNGEPFYVKFENGIKGTKSDRTPDFIEANKALREKYGNNVVSDLKSGNFTIDGKQYVWHHHQDAKTLIPVRVEIHNKTLKTDGVPGVGHTGGIAVKQHNSQLEDPLIFASPYTHEAAKQIID